MTGRSRTRLIGAASGALGLGMLTFGDALAGALVGQNLDDRARLAVRALGVRHGAQALIAIVAPASRPARWARCVDLLHAISMAAAASRPSRWRTLYQLAGALGGLMLAGDLWARRPASRRTRAGEATV